jgi:hypothetical protein
MDFDLDGYSDRLIEAFAEAMVMSVFFFRVGQSLVADFRTAGDVGPVVLLDPIVATPQDRLLSFRRLRPDLPLPDEITLAPWADRIRDFEERGVLAALLARCHEVGGDALSDEARKLFETLVHLERKIMQEMVRGIGMETIWQRPADKPH